MICSSGRLMSRKSISCSARRSLRGNAENDPRLVVVPGRALAITLVVLKRGYSAHHRRVSPATFFYFAWGCFRDLCLRPVVIARSTAIGAGRSASVIPESVVPRAPRAGEGEEEPGIAAANPPLRE